jgi:hypothetical protein
VLRIVEIDVGISKMHFEPVMQIRVFRASGHFGQCIVFERVNATKTSQAIGISRHLLAQPVVLGFDMSILIGKGVVDWGFRSGTPSTRRLRA